MTKELSVTISSYTLLFNRIPQNDLIKEIVNYFTYYNGLIPCLEIEKVLSNVCKTNITVQNTDIGKFYIHI